MQLVERLLHICKLNSLRILAKLSIENIWEKSDLDLDLQLIYKLTGFNLHVKYTIDVVSRYLKRKRKRKQNHVLDIFMA